MYEQSKVTKWRSISKTCSVCPDAFSNDGSNSCNKALVSSVNLVNLSYMLPYCSKKKKKKRNGKKYYWCFNTTASNASGQTEDGTFVISIKCCFKTLEVQPLHTWVSSRSTLSTFHWLPCILWAVWLQLQWVKPRLGLLTIHSPRLASGGGCSPTYHSCVLLQCSSTTSWRMRSLKAWERRV